jgi:hypothetical protein
MFNGVFRMDYRHPQLSNNLKGNQMYLQIIRASYAKIPLFLPAAKARGISGIFQ